MSGDDIKVNMMVVYTIVNHTNHYIKQTQNGDFVLEPNLKGAHLFRPTEAKKFIQMAQQNINTKLLFQAVK